MTGQGIAVLGALFGIRVLSEMMTPAEYGLLTLGMTLATLSSQVLFGPLCAGAARFYSAAQEARELKSYLSGVSRLAALGTGVIALLAVASAAIAALIGWEYWIALIVSALIFSVLSGYNSIASAIQNVVRQRSIVAFHAGAASWTRFLIAAVLMLGLGVSGTIALWGYTIATVGVLASQYFFLRPILKHSGSGTSLSDATRAIWVRKIIDYSWPFATWGIFFWFQVASDRWALATFSSTAEVGLFAVLYQLGYYPLALFADMLAIMISPILFQRAGDGSNLQRLNHARGLTLRIMVVILLIGGGVSIITAYGHDWIFYVFVAEKYASVSYLLPWLTLSGGIFAAAQMLSIDRMSALDTKGLIAPKVVTAIVGGLLNVTGAYLYGIQGVVAASLIFSLIYFGWLLFQYLSHSTLPSET